MKIKRFKLNALSAEGLRQKEMNAIVGGQTCGCSCYYANAGGSSANCNSGANYSAGIDHSPVGCNDYLTVNGEFIPSSIQLNESYPF